MAVADSGGKSLLSSILTGFDMLSAVFHLEIGFS